MSRNRRLAGAVLAVMAAVFIMTHLVADSTAVRLLRSMAEAGMIGGLADWFAVEALFRRPLGLPIPHTALLPANQARAARNVGRFFETHFLEPKSLESRLRAIRPGSYALSWLANPANARLVSQECLHILAQLLRMNPTRRDLVHLRRYLRDVAKNDTMDAPAAKAAAGLLKSGLRSAALNELIAFVQRAIDENRDVAARLVQQQSKWWIASAIDRRIADVVVDGTMSLLAELRQDGSPLRLEFQSAFDRTIDQLEARGDLTHLVRDARAGLIDSGRVETTLLRLAELLRNRLRAGIEHHPDQFAEPIGKLISIFAARILHDDAARASLDEHLPRMAAKLIGDLRPAIAGYVADVIAGWAPEELNERFESEIGPDLQFIRINGAILGAMIGGALFGLNQLLG